MPEAGEIGLVFAIAAVVALGLWLFIAGPWRLANLRLAPALEPVTQQIERSARLRTFEQFVYGQIPPSATATVLERRVLRAGDAGGIAGVEQCSIAAGQHRFNLALVRPPGQAPAPVVLVQVFGGLRAAFPGRPPAIAAPLHGAQWYCNAAWFDPIARAIFGRHVNEPPINAIIARGHAVALIYGGDVAPDLNKRSREAIAAWAWQFSRAFDVLAQDARLDADRVAVFGQSRQGKSALLAAARDERFAAAIVLQGGRGGDAPMRGLTGEPIAKMMRTYPHWFTPAFGRCATTPPDFDTQHLIALIAPRPLLIGHARRDEWADPAGAIAAFEAAKSAWGDAPPPLRFMRDGGHGIHAEDWRVALEFLDAHL
jgi:dienelactone hydrolase